MVKPGDIGGTGWYGNSCVVGFIVIGAIEEQTDMQAACTGGGTAQAALSIQLLAVQLHFSGLLVVIGPY
ncbi:hypothetical protein D3C75_1316080 [compost metagenome]